LVKKHEVEGNKALFYQFLQLFLWDSHIRWANSEQCNILTFLPTQGASLPSSKGFQKNRYRALILGIFLTEESEWFRNSLET
jgi:hypothetical protein